MRFRTWPLAALALCALLALVVVAVLESSRRAQEIYSRLDGLNQHYHDVETKLRRLRSDVNLSGIWIRDYLLDPDRERAPHYRQRVAEFRRTNMAAFADLRAVMPRDAETEQRLVSLQAKLQEYWEKVDPLFRSTPDMESTQFLKTEVVPRREAVLAITSEIENLNTATMAAQRTAVRQQQAELRRGLFTVLWGALVLGLVVAVTAVYRLRRLERRSEEQRTHAEEAERQMRALSQQLVATQEKERTKLSRELHDHVGQMLTALRMELGTVDRLRSPDDGAIARAVAEARHLVDTMVRTVRDLALGLRPSMLDDLGLQPALEWHAREFTRRYQLPVDLRVSGNVDALPDPHRTTVYRIIQEALTNCARHAGAEQIRIKVTRAPDDLELSVTDDGCGFDVEKRRGGLGLRGIEERVRELRGDVRIRSVKGAGTTVWVRLPLAQHLSEEINVARAAG